MFNSVAADDQDSVRLLTIQLSIDLFEKLSQDDINENIIPTVLNLSRDSSWKVRYMVAEKLVNV